MRRMSSFSHTSDFPGVENSCEINPSHMVFIIFNLVQCIEHDVCALKCKLCDTMHFVWLSI